MSVTTELGHLPHVVLPEDYQLHPGPFLAEMHARHGAVFASTSAWGDEFAYLVGPEANHIALVTHGAAFSHYAGWNTTESGVRVFGRGLVFEDGEEHAQHRRLLEPAFAAARLTDYLPDIRSVVSRRLDTWLDIGLIDAYDEAHRLTFEIAARSLFGIDEPDRIEAVRAVFLELLNLDFRALDHAASEGLGWAEDRLATLQEQLNDLVRAEIRRGDSAGQDVLRLLVHGGLTEEEVLAHVNVMLLAAHATTTGLCAWLIYLLAAHSDYQERVAAEVAEAVERDLLTPLPVLDRAVLETERLYPPIANLPRVAVRDVEIDGRVIPRGALAFVAIAGTHHLPDVFINPGAFDPDRFAPPRQEHRRTPYSLVGFSTGPRRCLGVRVARLEAKVIAAEAVRRFRLRPLAGFDAEVIYHPIAMPLRGIPVLVERRAP